MVNITEWELYNRGECELEFFDRHEKGFTGKMEDFLKEHGDLTEFKNKTTGMVVLLNHYGEIAARTPDKKEPK